MFAKLENQQEFEIDVKPRKVMMIMAFGEMPNQTYGWSDKNSLTHNIHATNADKCYYATLYGRSISDYRSINSRLNRDSIAENMSEIIARMDGNRGTEQDIKTLAYYAKEDGMIVEIE